MNRALTCVLAAALMFGAAACAGGGSSADRPSANAGSPYAGVNTSVASSPVTSVIADNKGTYVSGRQNADPDNPSGVR
jgi:hypothetical protein